MTYCAYAHFARKIVRECSGIFVFNCTARRNLGLSPPLDKEYLCVMALPHLPTTYTTRKNIYEAALVNRRTKENDFRDKWSNHANYFNRENVTANVKKTWESDGYFQSSMNAFKSNYDKDTKALNLKRRRLRLAEMLKEEQDSLCAELKCQSGDNYHRLADMRDRSEALRSAREEKRQQLAQEKLYEHWRVNSPDIRQLESARHEKHVIDKWGSQVTENMQKIEEEKERLREEELRMERVRQLALEDERRRELERLEEEKQLAVMLKKQMHELKHREDESKRLKRKEEYLMREQWELNRLEEERKAMEGERKKVEFGRGLLRQHAAALRRRSKQVQDELEQDRQFLLRLAEQESQTQEVMTARREKAQAEATWMRQVIEDQLRVEKAREAELDMLYQDEAARIWQQREAEWTKERAARQRLMKEVMDGRQDQLAAKMETVRAQQEESLRRREELLHELEIANQMTQREVEDQTALRTARKQELEAQMRAKREEDAQERLRLKLDLEEEENAEGDYEAMLAREARSLQLHEFQPKDYSRKTAWT